MCSQWVSYPMLVFLLSMVVMMVPFDGGIGLCLAHNGVRPVRVNVGALEAYKTTIGRVAKKAIELAVEDVNKDQTVLNGTQLVLTMMDSNCSALIGMSAALELMKKDNVAIVGPHSSVIAHVVANIASELQVPILSFGATDPSLSSYQYPYFFRLAHSDIYVMKAVASLIGFFGWRNIVTVYIDDDYGRNGIAALRDALANIRVKIVNKVALPLGVNRSEIGRVLAKLALMESRIFIVHMNPDTGLNLFSEAHFLGMLSNSYVWIATDWLSSVLDSNILDYETMNSLQGVIALRQHVPISHQEHAFTTRWNTLHRARSVDVRLNAFGLYAYDAIWAIAHSIDVFFDNGGNITFADYPQISNASGRKSEIAKLKIFKGGPQLRKRLLQSNFTGLTGPVKFDKNRDLLGSTFEIINIVGTGFRKVSYWMDQSGLSVVPPESRITCSDIHHIVGKKLYDIIWPGQSKLIPRGWVFPNNGKQLVIAVPRKVGFQEIVTTVEGTHMMKGFCIDVFVAALSLLPYPVPYTFVSFGNVKESPSYDELVQQVAFKNFDAAVGDISITTKRLRIADFTQPYIESGLAVLTSLQEVNSSGTWTFLRPFTIEMWCTTGAFFLVIGVVVWILEHKSNPDFRGHPKKQCLTILWFSFSTLVFSRKQKVVTSFGRAVLIIWLFVVLIINSSYTANLTSILTVQQLSPTTRGIDHLIGSNKPIGYQAGSFVGDYLQKEFNVDKSRLVPLDSKESYAKALLQGPRKGGVAAIVDELPIIQLFLSNQCGFTSFGTEITKGGWGFAFQKDSQLAIDMSTAIMTLSESGKLQSIHDKWLSKTHCGSQDTQVESTQLHLKSFWSLFLISGVASFTALVIFLGCMNYRSIQHFRNDGIRDSPTTSGSLTSRTADAVTSFANGIDEEETNEKKEGSTNNSEIGEQRQHAVNSASSVHHLEPCHSCHASQ